MTTEVIPRVAPPPTGWYHVTVVGPLSPGLQWINMAHIMRMLPHPDGGTKLFFTDGTMTRIEENIE